MIEAGDAVAPVVEEIPLENDGKRDLRAEAASLEHLMTHTPFNGHCPSCVRAKMVRKPARRVNRDPASTPKKFGDLVNADHIIAHSDEAMGLTGERDALAVVDRFSNYVDCFPLMTKTADDAHRGCSNSSVGVVTSTCGQTAVLSSSVPSRTCTSRTARRHRRDTRTTVIANAPFARSLKEQGRFLTTGDFRVAFGVSRCGFGAMHITSR